MSPLLHVGGAAVVVSSVAPDREQPPAAPPQAEQPPPDNRAVAVGIERSKSATITWIGFETPTEHAAPQSDTEQPALALDAPAPPVQTTQSPTDAEGESELRPSASAAASAPTEAVQEPSESAETASASDSVPPEAPISPQTAAAERLIPAMEEFFQRLVLATAATSTPEARQTPTPAESAPPSPESSPATPAPAAKPPTDPAAEQSQKESSPFSLTKPLVVRPGKPAAAEGLEIETRHLRLSLYTQVTAGPSRARVLATFNRAGRVTNVEFIRRTGYKDVDEPILDCVYSWRAKGKALEALDPKNPDAGLVVPFEIVLR